MSFYFPAGGPDATNTHEPMPDWAFDAILKHLQSTVSNLKDWHWWRVEPTSRHPPSMTYIITLVTMIKGDVETEAYGWSYEEDEPGIYLIYWRKAE